MKKISLIFLFFLSLFSLSAETLHLDTFSSKNFVSDINSALISESPEILVKAASPYLSKMHELNIPDCFGCSLYLLKMTENADPAMQLALNTGTQELEKIDMKQILSLDAEEQEAAYMQEVETAVSRLPSQSQELFEMILDY